MEEAKSSRQPVDLSPGPGSGQHPVSAKWRDGQCLPIGGKQIDERIERRRWRRRLSRCYISAECCLWCGKKEAWLQFQIFAHQQLCYRWRRAPSRGSRLEEEDSSGGAAAVGQGFACHRSCRYPEDRLSCRFNLIWCYCWQVQDLQTFPLIWKYFMIEKLNFKCQPKGKLSNTKKLRVCSFAIV